MGCNYVRIKTCRVYDIRMAHYEQGNYYHNVKEGVLKINLFLKRKLKAFN